MEFYVCVAAAVLSSTSPRGEWGTATLANELLNNAGTHRAPRASLTFPVWDALRDGVKSGVVRRAVDGDERTPSSAVQQRPFTRSPPPIAAARGERAGLMSRCDAARRAAPSDARWRRYSGAPSTLQVYAVTNAYVTFEGLLFDRERFITDGSSRLVLDALDAGTRLRAAVKLRPGVVHPVVTFDLADMRLASVVVALRDDAQTLLYDEVATFGAQQRITACADAAAVHVRTFSGTLAVGLRVFALNYYHFVAEFLPHLVLLAEFIATRPLGSDAVRLLVYDEPHILEFIDLLGVDRDDVVLFDPCIVYRAAHIVFVPAHEAPVPSAASVARVREAVAFAFPRPLPLMSPTARRGKILLIDRGEARHRAIANAAQLLAAMQRAVGTQGADAAAADVVVFACERHSVREQLAAFSDATLVVGAEGACLANMLFTSRDHVAIVDIVPAAADFGPFPSSCGMTYAWHLAETLPNVEYSAFLLPTFTWADTLVVPAHDVAEYAVSQWRRALLLETQTGEGGAGGAAGALAIDVVVDGRAVAVKLCAGCDAAHTAAEFCRAHGLEKEGACRQRVERRLRYELALARDEDTRVLSVDIDGVEWPLSAPRSRSAKWAAREFAAAHGLDDATAESLETLVRAQLWNETLQAWSAAVVELEAGAQLLPPPKKMHDRFAAIVRGLAGADVAALIQHSRAVQPLFDERRYTFLQRAVLCPERESDACAADHLRLSDEWPRCAALHACAAEAAFESDPTAAAHHVAAAIHLDPTDAAYERLAQRFVGALQPRVDEHDCAAFPPLKAILDALHAHLLAHRRFVEAGVVAVRAWSASCTNAQGDTLDIDDCGSERAARRLDEVELGVRGAEERGERIAPSERCGDRDSETSAAWTSGLRQFLREQSRACTSVDYADLTVDVFKERFLQAAEFGEPVVVRGGALHWDLLNASFAELQRRFGGHAVKVSVAPNGEFDVVEPAALWREAKEAEEEKEGDEVDVLVRPAHLCARLDAALKLVQSPLRAQSMMRGGGGGANASTRNEGTAKFYIEYVDLLTLGAHAAEELREPPWLRELELTDIKLWLGGGCASARAKIHFDPEENLMVQLAGRKTFVLFHPRDVRALHFNPLGLREASLRFSFEQGFTRDHPSSAMKRITVNFAPVNISAPDYARFPKLKEATPIACTIDAGDVLYVPSFWWHEVISEARAGTPNLAVNFWYKARRARLAGGSLAL